MSTIADTVIGLTATQRKYAAIIERILSSKGVPPEIIAGAIVNAKAESSLNPKAIGDGGNSVGLFQLHKNGGGKGMSVAERQDPEKNTLRIYKEYLTYGKPLRDAYAKGDRSVATYAALWSTYIERPADKVGEAKRRAKAALALFPAPLPQVARIAAFEWSWGMLIGGVVVAGLIYRHRRRGAAHAAPSTTAA